MVFYLWKEEDKDKKHLLSRFFIFDMKTEV